MFAVFGGRFSSPLHFNMRTRSLGRSGLVVSEIGLGGLFIGNESEDAGVQIVRRALELGVTYFDTAPSYFGGQVQNILGRALEGVTVPHVVSTKVGPHPDFPHASYDRDSVLRQVEWNLKSLRRDKLDIVMIHDPDRYGDRANPGQLAPVFGRGMALETLEELKAQGVIRAIGLGNLWCDYQARCVESGRIDLVLSFNRYGLIWRDAQFQVHPFCRRHNVGVVQGTPMHQGVLAEPRREWLDNPPDWMTAVEHDRYRRLLQIQVDAGIPLAELALRYILQNPTISTTIPGAATLGQLEANVACAAKGPLPEEVTAAIDALGILHDDPRRYT